MDDKALAAAFNEELFQPAGFHNGSRPEAFGMHSYSTDWFNSNFHVSQVLPVASTLSSRDHSLSNNTVVYHCGMVTNMADAPQNVDVPVFSGTGLFVNTSPGHCSSVSTPESLRSSDLNCAVSSGSTNASVSSILQSTFPLLINAQLDHDDVFSEKLSLQPLSSVAVPPPSTDNFAGNFNFELSLPPNGGRAATWIFSEKLKKLYVHISSACPIRVRTTGLSYTDCIVRATAIYTRAEHASEPVRCCIQHQSKDGEPGGDHLIRIAQGNATYIQDALTQRQSVTLPLQPQSDWTTMLLQFSCFSSCAGGQNRRPMCVVFTLERLRRGNDDCLQYEVLGRTSLEVRACACPRRDAKWDEEVLVATSGTRSGPPPRRGPLTAPQYTLTVRGGENFRLLKRIRDALELADAAREQCTPKRRRRDARRSAPTPSPNSPSATSSRTHDTEDCRDESDLDGAYA